MKWTQGTVERKVVWAPGLFTIKVRCPGVKAFEPGQFLQLGMDVDGHHVHRPYSVASPAGDSLEFFIVLVEDGKLSPLLWRLQPGDQLDVSESAAGGFTLSHCPDASVLWLLATGTGIAPYIAMLRTASPWQRYRRVVFVHGVRKACDLAYQNELNEYAARYGNRFRYAPVVSREEKPGALYGRITTCLANGSLENVVDQPMTSDACVMMCGNPEMLDETEKLLVSRGLKKHRAKDPGNIVVERYW